MTVLQAILLVLAAAGGTAVVLTREPKRQAYVLGLQGLILTILFLSFQAPDVALSELAVGAAALPLMLLVALANLEGHEVDRKAREDEKP
ncbi:MAG TPA: hydrogenase subunit MbhD domain-containing protein [Isosphaeraceae bacterium]|jgi:uncharacterized MnhB-related membrane protein|nr:hydrogenase subunit MbhD domain-containing protein [Isosphaeraceae bacterium]